jgi:hypothetical protein
MLFLRVAVFRYTCLTTGRKCNAFFENMNAKKFLAKQAVGSEQTVFWTEMASAVNNSAQVDKSQQEFIREMVDRAVGRKEVPDSTVVALVTYINSCY